MHWIIFVLAPLTLTASHVSSTDWSKEYTGFCDTHEYYASLSDRISSSGIYPEGLEFKFWQLAVRLIQKYSGWGKYKNLPKEFYDAVQHRNRVEGTLDFKTYMPSLAAESYTQALKRIRQLVTDDMHQWWYYPDCNSLRRLIGHANAVVNLRQMQLDRGDRDGDSADIISCHEHVLGIWDELRNKLEDLYDKEYVQKGYCNNCGHCIRINGRHDSVSKNVDSELALHILECYVCRSK